MPAPASMMGSDAMFESNQSRTYSRTAPDTFMSSRATNEIGTRASGRTARGRTTIPDTSSNDGGSSRATRTFTAVSVRSFLPFSSRTRTSRRTPLLRSGNVAVAPSRSGLRSIASTSDFGAPSGASRSVRRRPDA